MDIGELAPEDISIDTDGINGYLTEQGLRTVGSIGIVSNSNKNISCFHPGTREVKIGPVSIRMMEANINIIRKQRENGHPYNPPAFLYINIGPLVLPHPHPKTFPYSLTRMCQLLPPRKPVLEEIAEGIEEKDPTIASIATITAHELGHGQENLDRNYLLSLVLGGVLSTILSTGYLYSSIARSGQYVTVPWKEVIPLFPITVAYFLCMQLLGRTISEYRADKFASEHANNLTPFIKRVSDDQVDS